MASLSSDRRPPADASAASRRRDQRLRPFERMQTSRDFRRVFEEGRRFRTESLRIRYLATDREYSRLGLVVSKRHGGAVARTRTKRRLRTCFRSIKYELPSSHDIVLLPNGPPRTQAEYAACLREFVEYLGRKAQRETER